jgi:hypothetical protein
MARKSRYHACVQPFTDTIVKRIQEGHTEQEIARDLGVSVSAWCEYKLKFPEFGEATKNARVNFEFSAVKVARAGLLKRAEGFTYQEKKTYNKTDADGTVMKYIEITEKYCVPDVGAAHLLLKNYDRSTDGSHQWCDNPIGLNIKLEELDLKKRLAEKDLWEING